MTSKPSKIGRSVRLSLAPDVHARRFDDEVVILDLASGAYFSLDAIGADMWEALAQGHSAEEVATKLRERYEATDEVLLADVAELAQKLVDAGLAVIATERP